MPILRLAVSLTLLYFVISSGQSNDVCSYLRRGAEELCQGSMASSAQGPPGKRGPPGAPGSIGRAGPPGRCNCSLDEMLIILRNIPDLNKLVCTVGMEDGRVKDEDITASSSWSKYYFPKYARLDSTFSSTAKFWHPGRGQYDRAWIQIDLRRTIRVTGITTQGRTRKQGSSHQWTASYKISYGNEASNLEVLQDSSGNDIIFQGNRDTDSHVTNKFLQPLIARYFRVTAHTYNHVPILRIELLTC